MSLHGLLDYLGHSTSQPAHEWEGWQIERVAGGSNGLVYHVRQGNEAYAIKFAMRDQRQRAKREFQALTALHQAGLDLAPQPVLLDTKRYPQDVTVQSWLNGVVTNEPPQTDTHWQRLIDHFVTVHQFTSDKTTIQLEAPVLNCQTAAEGVERTRWQMLQLPEPPPELRQLFDRLESSPAPSWQSPALTLCRTDPNTTNFVRGSDYWRSVDWENSGWGDPAFEISDMMIHPAYLAVSSERWDWVINRYIAAVNDPNAEIRIRTYYRIFSVWWVARMARFLYEIPRGLDQRLVERPPEWQAEAQQKYDHYLKLAQSLIGD